MPGVDGCHTGLDEGRGSVRMSEQERQDLIERIVMEAIKRVISVLSSRLPDEQYLKVGTELIVEIAGIPSAFGIPHAFQNAQNHKLV
jgi:hypothetical protein